MNNAEEIFGAICTNKYEEIQGFVAPPGREEGLFLEFKEKHKPNTPNLSQPDQIHYSEALSGFANSDGGVLIWGITCKKENDMDTASKKKPITGVRQFVSNLNSLTASAVSPIVEGVKHKEITIPGKVDCGYVATLIPASDGGPHRTLINGTKKNYYKRVGDSFVVMEHYELADMFGRRKKPKLSLHITLADTKIKLDETVRLDLVVSISNNGRGIAKYPYLYLKLPSPYYVSEYGIDGNKHHGLPLFPGSNRQGPKFCGGANDAIPQGANMSVTTIRAEISSQGVTDFVTDYELGAEDIMTTAGTCRIKAEEIVQFLAKQGCSHATRFSPT